VCTQTEERYRERNKLPVEAMRRELESRHGGGDAADGVRWGGG
jgi:hypothetical protein